MAAKEFEALGELEEELQEEAAELEPLFSRARPVRVSRAAPNAVYLGDLESELEEEAEELEPLFSRRSALEFELPAPVRRPAPNAVDPEAAEPIFSGRVRTPEPPLLDAATLKSSKRWNQDTHPKVSGITLAELQTRLERYIDRATLDDLVRRASADAAKLDEATLVTLLAHQFQRKTCRTPTVGDITKACTTNGRVAEDTLDALGFVFHTGKSLNTADQPNSVAAATLGRVPANAFVGIEPGLTAKTWWSYMVSPPWLGLPIKQGIHLVLLKRLRRAQQTLMSLPAYANLGPAELGKALGLEEEHKGARPSVADWSMHLFGLAIDIGYTRNPWLSNPKRDTAKLAAITLRAARLVGSSEVGAGGITARYLHGLAITYRGSEEIHKILAEWSRRLAEYFALAGDSKRLQSLLPLANVIYPGAGWFRPDESLAAAATRWTRVVQNDFNDFAAAVSRGGNQNEIRHGFMDLARDLVIALRDEGCLGWGAVDFGPAASGDVMHFDCRIDGIGRTIAETSGKPFVPRDGHPCIPAAAVSPAQHEFEREAWARRGAQARKTPRPQHSPAPAPSLCAASTVTVGKWSTIKIDPKVIPLYKDEGGTPRPTDCAVNVPAVLEKKSQIDLLVFFHGLNIKECQPCFDPDPSKTLTKFGLDAQINDPKRPVVLAVPQLFWTTDPSGANVAKSWTAANFNKFVGSVLAEIGKGGVARALVSLTIAGHSRAYAILTPFALEFNQGTATTTTPTEPLAKLVCVLAMDSTYNPSHVRALEAWAAAKPAAKFLVVYSAKGSERGRWLTYYKDYSFGFGPPPNLKMCTVPEQHCELPTKYVGQLLAATSYPPSWCKATSP
jgi:hypothetical protein